MWAALAGAGLAASFALHHDYLILRVWCALTVLSGLGPPLIAAGSELVHRLSRWRLPTVATFRGRARVHPAPAGRVVVGSQP
jgi:hypothetical protein